LALISALEQDKGQPRIAEERVLCLICVLSFPIGLSLEYNMGFKEIGMIYD
jgi:hypothetical protein